YRDIGMAPHGQQDCGGVVLARRTGRSRRRRNTGYIQIHQQGLSRDPVDDKRRVVRDPLCWVAGELGARNLLEYAGHKGISLGYQRLRASTRLGQEGSHSGTKTGDSREALGSGALSGLLPAAVQERFKRYPVAEQ